MHRSPFIYQSSCSVFRLLRRLSMTSPRANCASKTKILILDDEPIVCKRLRPAFQKAGYDVETFTDSASAMARVEEKVFDIVITDLKMEGTDGMRFLARVKEIAPDTGVIVITGFATP